MKLAVIVPASYKDWEAFQSILDSIQEFYELKWLVAHKAHKLISLYSKTDIVTCYIHSLLEPDKYDMAVIFSTKKDSMSQEKDILKSFDKPYLEYLSDIDEIEWIGLKEDLILQNIWKSSVN